MRADLHLHSVYSDGKYSPEEIARRAKQAGVKLFSLTDHDNMGGSEEAEAAAQKYGLHFVRGWEVSSYDDCKVHVLGYGCRGGAAYRDFLERRKTGGLLRARDMLEKANSYFCTSLTMNDVEREHLKKDAPLHTMHVVRAFARRLSVKADALYLSAFDRGKPCYSDLYRPSPEHAIEAIRADGGISSLAHPGRIALDFAAKEALMLRLVSAGLDGIECVYTTHTAEETAYFEAFARRRGLLMTGGSDFHEEGGRAVLGNPAFRADGRLLAALGIPFGGGGE